MISFLLFSKALCPLPRWVLSGDKYPFGPKYLPGVWHEQWPLRKVPSSPPGPPGDPASTALVAYSCLPSHPSADAPARPGLFLLAFFLLSSVWSWLHPTRSSRSGCVHPPVPLHRACLLSLSHFLLSPRLGVMVLLQSDQVCGGGGGMGVLFTLNAMSLGPSS